VSAKFPPPGRGEEEVHQATEVRWSSGELVYRAASRQRSLCWVCGATVMATGRRRRRERHQDL
jgi:hypothetical protein